MILNVIRLPCESFLYAAIRVLVIDIHLPCWGVALAIFSVELNSKVLANICVVSIHFPRDLGSKSLHLIAYAVQVFGAVKLRYVCFAA